MFYWKTTFPYLAFLVVLMVTDLKSVLGGASTVTKTSSRKPSLIPMRDSRNKRHWVPPNKNAWQGKMEDHRLRTDDRVMLRITACWNIQAGAVPLLLSAQLMLSACQKGDKFKISDKWARSDEEWRLRREGRDIIKPREYSERWRWHRGGQSVWWTSSKSNKMCGRDSGSDVWTFLLKKKKKKNLSHTNRADILCSHSSTFLDTFLFYPPVILKLFVTAACPCLRSSCCLVLFLQVTYKL